jgi:hypothetical protein
LPASGNGGHDSSIDLRWHFEIAAIKLVMEKKRSPPVWALGLVVI